MALLAMTGVFWYILGITDTFPISYCHCEPVRKLAWQSVLSFKFQFVAQQIKRKKVRSHLAADLFCEIA